MKNIGILFIIFVVLLFQKVAWAQPAINLFSTGEHSVYHLQPATSKINNRYILEPADPDKQDMSVWKNIKPGVHASFGSLDVAYSKNIPPQGKVQENTTIQGWRGERVNCLLLVWSSGNKNEISIKGRYIAQSRFDINFLKRNHEWFLK